MTVTSIHHGRTECRVKILNYKVQYYRGTWINNESKPPTYDYGLAIIHQIYISFTGVHRKGFWNERSIATHSTLWFILLPRACRGRDRMIVGFTTTYAIDAYHHWCCGLDSHSGRGVQHYVIKFVQVLRFPPPIKLTVTIYIVTEILLKVALNTIKPINK